MKDTELQLLESHVNFQARIHKLKSDQYESIARSTPNINDPLLTYCREELNTSWVEYQSALKKLNDYARSMVL